MADLTQTAADVAPGSLATAVGNVTAGETIAAGEPVVEIDGKYYLAHADDATDADTRLARAGRGGVAIALSNASADEVLLIAKRGEVDLGASLAVGEVYIVSDTPGRIAPVSDFAGYTDAVCTILGQAVAADRLRILGGYTGANNVA